MNSQKLFIDYVTSQFLELARTIDYLEKEISKSVSTIREKNYRHESTARDQVRLEGLKDTLRETVNKIRIGGHSEFMAMKAKGYALADKALYYDPKNVSDEVKEMFDTGIVLSDAQFKEIFSGANYDEKRYIEAKTGKDMHTVSAYMIPEQETYKQALDNMFKKYEEIVTDPGRAEHRASYIEKLYPVYAEAADSMENYLDIEPTEFESGKKTIWFDKDTGYDLPKEEADNE